MRPMLLCLVLALPLAAIAQTQPDTPTQVVLPPPSTPSDQPAPPPDQGALPQPTDQTITATPADAAPSQQEPPPNGAVLPPMSTPQPAQEVPTIEGHPRTGPFLSGPGSLTFVMHHSLLGLAGGLVTQGVANDWNFDVGSREAILAGALVGTGVGFGTAAWWQFHHWIGRPAATMTVVNSLVGGMFLGGLMDLTTKDSTALAWSGFLGAELGAWLSIGIGGGDLSVEHALLLGSGEGWAEIYASLLLAIVHFSGSSLTTSAGLDTLLIAPAVGATFLAVSSAKFHPTTRQILRADMAGAAVGGSVLLLSALVLGHLDIPTPYVLSMLSSATTMAIVSIFWDDRVPTPMGSSGATAYRSEWW